MARKPSTITAPPLWGQLFQLCGWSCLVVCVGCGSLKSRQTAESTIRSRELACRGIDASEHGRHSEAEQIFRQALEMSPADERARQHFAESLWKRGAKEEALTQMSESVRLSGGCPELTVRMGEMYLAAGKPEFAAVAAERALSANCKLAAAWALKGDVARARGQADEALASYHRALAYEENNARVQLAAAEVYRGTQRPQRALTALQAMREQVSPGSESAEMLHLEGLVLRDLARFDAAAESLNAAIAKGNAPAQFYTDLAATQLLANRPERAEAALSLALALDPAHAPSLDLMSRTRMQRERMSASVEHVPTGSSLR